MEMMTTLAELNIADPATLLLVSAAVTSFVTAFFVGLVNLVGVLKTNNQLKENNAKLDTTIHKVAEVHTLADGNLSKMREELHRSNQQVESLIATVQDLKSEREKASVEKAGLAAVAASAQTSMQANAAPVVPEVQKVKMVNTEEDPAIVKPVPEDKKL